MTTREFINKNFGIPSSRDRFCSSVFADKHGNIYSYGYHYPLLFTVDNKVFRNVVGYSNTTAKHISWTYDIKAIDVELRGCNQYTWRNPENTNKVPHLLYLAQYDDGDTSNKALKIAVKNDLKAKQKELKDTMDSKKRKDTQVYKALEYGLNNVNNALALV